MTLEMGSHQFRAKILHQLPDQPEFTPGWLCSNAHVQTLSGALLRDTKVPFRQRIRLELKDDDFVDVDYCDNQSDQGVIIFHGVGGSSHSRYVLELQSFLNSGRLTSIAVNLRGASGEPNQSVKAYHAGAGDEITDILQALLPVFEQRSSVKIWHLIGYSLSGSMLIHWWSKQRHFGLPIGLTMTVCAPLKLFECARALNRGLGLCYQRFLLSALKVQFQSRLEYFEQKSQQQGGDNPLKAFQHCLKGRSFWEFDDWYVAPAHGFSGVIDYYHRASAIDHLKLGRWPLLMIQSKDDPLIPYFHLTDDLLSSSVSVWQYDRAGHVGFMQLSRDGIHSGLVEIIARALSACLDQQ